MGVELAKCPYVRLFEGIKPGLNAAGEPCERNIPNPYVIEPFPLSTNVVKAGIGFAIRLVLFGEAVHFYREAIQAFAISCLGGFCQGAG